VTLLSANYPTDMNSRFISPYFILPQGSPYLRFWHWFSFNGSYDNGVVEIRVGTNAWQAVSPVYVGASQNWTEPFVDLTSFGGQTVQQAFHAASGGATDSGWYVDDIQVYPYTLPATTPYMNIKRSGTNIIVNWTWLTNYTGFALRSTTNLASTNLISTNWSSVSPLPVILSGQNIVTNPMSGAQKYFRLRQ
jgi:hypothetical protein